MSTSENVVVPDFCILYDYKPSDHTEDAKKLSMFIKMLCDYIETKGHKKGFYFERDRLPGTKFFEELNMMIKSAFNIIVFTNELECGHWFKYCVNTILRNEIEEKEWHMRLCIIPVVLNNCKTSLLNYDHFSTFYINNDWHSNQEETENHLKKLLELLKKEDYKYKTVAWRTGSLWNKREMKKLFVGTKRSNLAGKMMENVDHILISGGSGEGKTFLAKRLIQIYLNFGYTCTQLSTPDMLKNRDHFNKTIYFIENVFGATYFDVGLAKEWCDILESMQYHIHEHTAAFVMTTSDSILKESKNYIERLGDGIFSNVLDLTIETLSDADKKLLLEKHLSFYRMKDFNEADIQDIISRSQCGFPNCCRLYCSISSLRAMGIKYFENPKQCLKQIVTDLAKHNDGMFKVLFFAAITGGKGLADLKVNERMQEMYQEKIEAIGINKKYLDIVSEINKSSYMIIEGSDLVFRHISICEEILSVALSTFPELTIKYCPLDLLLRHIRSVCKQVANIEKDYPLLSAIYTKLAMSGYIKEVFSSTLIDDEHFIDAWIDYLNNKKNAVENISFCKYSSCNYHIIQYIAYAGITKLFNHVFSMIKSDSKENADKQLSEAFLVSCSKDNNIKMVNHLLQLHLSVFVTDEFGRNALHFACLGKVQTMVGFLLKMGILDKKDDFGNTAMHYLFLQPDTICNYTSFLSNFPVLRENVDSSIQAIMDMLIPTQSVDVLSKRDLMIENNDQKTPLHIAVGSHCSKNVVSMLLNSGALICALKRPILHEAIVSGYKRTDVIEFLLKNKADILTTDTTDEGNSILHKAVRYRGINFVKFLLNLDINIEAKNLKNTTPLLEAVTLAADSHEKIGMVKFLVKKHASINAVMKDGSTALHIASRGEKTISLVKFLVDNGAQIDAKAQDGSTALHCAVKRNNFDVMYFLISCNSIDINAKTVDGTTVLHEVVKNGTVENVNFLLKYGANKNTQKEDGATPLDIAIEHKNMSVVEFLKENGAVSHKSEISEKYTILDQNKNSSVKCAYSSYYSQNQSSNDNFSSKNSEIYSYSQHLQEDYSARKLNEGSDIQHLEEDYSARRQLNEGSDSQHLEEAYSARRQLNEGFDSQDLEEDYSANEGSDIQHLEEDYSARRQLNEGSDRQHLEEAYSARRQLNEGFDSQDLEEDYSANEDSDIQHLEEAYSARRQLNEGFDSQDLEEDYSANEDSDIQHLEEDCSARDDSDIQHLEEDYSARRHLSEDFFNQHLENSFKKRFFCCCFSKSD